MSLTPNTQLEKRTLVTSAAKVGKEPRRTNAAYRIDVCFWRIAAVHASVIKVRFWPFHAI